jgi:hypothetical protein
MAYRGRLFGWLEAVLSGCGLGVESEGTSSIDLLLRRGDTALGPLLCSTIVGIPEDLIFRHNFWAPRMKSCNGRGKEC